MAYYRIILIIFALFTSCAPIREIPVETITKEVVRDSIVYVQDTIEVPIKSVEYRDIIPSVDTSYLSTDVSESVAYLDTNVMQLHHTLKNKVTHLDYPIEHQSKIVTIEKTVNKEIPVEVPVQYTPKWCWILLSINIGLVCFVLGRLIFRHTR